MDAKAAKQAAVDKKVSEIIRITEDKGLDGLQTANAIRTALAEYETTYRASLLSEIEKKVVGAKKKCAKNHMTVVGHGCDGCPETTGGTCAKYIERIIKEAQEGEK